MYTVFYLISYNFFSFLYYCKRDKNLTSLILVNKFYIYKIFFTLGHAKNVYCFLQFYFFLKRGDIFKILFFTKYFSVFNFYTSVVLWVRKIHETTIFLNLPTYLNIRDWKVWKLKFKGSLPWIFENTIFKGPAQKDQVNQKVKQMENIAILCT